MSSYIATAVNFETCELEVIGGSNDPDEIKIMLINYLVDKNFLDFDREEDDISELYNMNLSSVINIYLTENDWYFKIHKLVQGKYENTDLREYGPKIELI